MQPQPQQPPYNAPPPTPKKSHVGTIVAVIVVAIVVIVAFTLLALWRTATLEVLVQSSHIVTTVSYEVTVDGENWAAGTLGPLEGQLVARSASWFGNSCKSSIVVGVSQGGALGPQTDQELATLCNGQAIRLTLVV